MMTKKEFLQHIKEDESYSPGWQAIMEDNSNIKKLIECMRADGNEDLVTDMRRTKSYL